MKDSQIYNHPEYYDLAFSFVKPRQQFRLFQKFISHYSKIKVRAVLDLACGPAPQLREFARHKYKTIGLDLNPRMLSYLREKTKAENLQVETVEADMSNFRLRHKVDLAYIMMGSIIYFKSNEEFLSHLNSVASALRSGGLYLIENFPLSWANPKFFKRQIWQIGKSGVKIKVTYKLSPKDELKQLVTQYLSLQVNDHRKRMRFIERSNLKLIFPEELLTLLSQNGQFEFLGFFERHRVKLLKKASPNNFVVLRKKYEK